MALRVSLATSLNRLVGPPRVELGTNGLCVPLQFSLPVSGLWSGLSLVFTTYPYSPYTFQTSLFGLARDRHASLPKEMVAAGYLVRKSGRGVYSY
jgi:hypothetical protein